MDAEDAEAEEKWKQHCQELVSRFGNRKKKKAQTPPPPPAEAEDDCPENYPELPPDPEFNEEEDDYIPEPHLTPEQIAEIEKDVAFRADYTKDHVIFDKAGYAWYVHTVNGLESMDLITEDDARAFLRDKARHSWMQRAYEAAVHPETPVPGKFRSYEGLSQEDIDEGWYKDEEGNTVKDSCSTGWEKTITDHERTHLYEVALEEAMQNGGKMPEWWLTAAQANPQLPFMEMEFLGPKDPTPTQSNDPLKPAVSNTPPPPPDERFMPTPEQIKRILAREITFKELAKEMGVYQEPNTSGKNGSSPAI